MAKIYGVGTGPGDKEYLTLKAVRILKEVDYIFVPNNKGKNIALDTVREFIDEENIVFLDYPMKFTNQETYLENARIIEGYLIDEKQGAFITIGDPMFYSTVLNTFRHLREDITQEFVSGIPSFVAAASVSKTPLALVGESLMVVDRVPETFLDNVNTYAVLKTYNLDDEKMDRIEENGFEYKYVERASFKEQKILNKKEDILNTKDYISLLLLRRK